MTLLDMVHPVLDPLMVAAGSGLGISWWMRHAVRAPAPEPEVPLVVELAESWVEFIWRTRVCGDEVHGWGALPGTYLTELRELSTGLDGHEAVIQLRPGRQSTQTAISAQDMVCSAFELPAGSVIIEPSPDQKRSIARLQIIRGRSPLYEVLHWDPKTMELDRSGVVRVGTYADGLPAHVRFWEPNSGGTNMLVAGAQGSGKSRFMSLLLGLSMRATYRDADGQEQQLVDTYLGCGQHGQSFPQWTRCKALRWMATTPQEIIWMVWSFREQMLARSEYLTNLEWTDDRGRVQHGLSEFDPVRARLPYAQLVIDEAAAAIALHPQMADWLYDIAKRGRKNGMRVVLATQSPSADELGGNSNLRAMLAAGGVVVFRVGDGHHGSMAFPSGECGAPHEIPSVTPSGESFQGAGYVAGPDNRGRALMRTLYIADPFGESSSARIWPLSDVDGKAGGELLAGFWDRQAARWAGEDPEPAILQRMADEEAAKVRANLERQAARDAGQAAEAPASSAPVSPDQDPDRPSLRVLVLDAVHAAQRDGREATTAEIKAAAAAWWSERSVTNELAALCDAGILDKPSKGRFRPAAVGAAAR